MKFKYKYVLKKLAESDTCEKCLGLFPTMRLNLNQSALVYIYTYFTSLGHICEICIDKLEASNPDFALGLGVTNE